MTRLEHVRKKRQLIHLSVTILRMPIWRHRPYLRLTKQFALFFAQKRLIHAVQQLLVFRTVTSDVVATMLGDLEGVTFFLLQRAAHSVNFIYLFLKTKMDWQM